MEKEELETNDVQADMRWTKHFHSCCWHCKPRWHHLQAEDRSKIRCYPEFPIPAEFEKLRQ